MDRERDRETDTGRQAGRQERTDRQERTVQGWTAQNSTERHITEQTGRQARHLARQMGR